MTSLKVALTGASSFTGYWLARELDRNTHTTYALVNRKCLENYSGQRKLRVNSLTRLLKQNCRFGMSIGSLKTLEFIRCEKPDFWIHHHHWMKDFRSADYDLNEMRKLCVDPLESVVSELAASGCSGLIYSGSYFEPGEGAADKTRTPYAKSKSQIWSLIVELTKEYKLPLAKVVLPNPVGLLEDEDRLTYQCLLKAKKGEVVDVFAPNSFMDCIPVNCLAQVYLKLMAEVSVENPPIARPSAWRGNVIEWIELLNKTLVPKLNLPSIQFEVKNIESTPVVFKNTDQLNVNWSTAWDDMIHGATS